MAKMGSYRWEGREKILRSLRDEARREIEEALDEVIRETGSTYVDYMDFENIVGAVLVDESVTDVVMDIIDRSFTD